MTTATLYVEVSEHDAKVEPVPFSHLRPYVPGAMYVSRLYGPYTVKGAERVAQRALNLADGQPVAYTVPGAVHPTGARYCATEHGATVVKILPGTPFGGLPYGWRRVTARNMPMVKRPTPQGTIWVCYDCMATDANGEIPDGRDETQPEPWSLDPSGDYTSGTLDHGCGLTDADRDNGIECDCERRDFSWSSCDACGSTLGGSRYAYTYWL